MAPFEPALDEDLSDANLARLLAADARSASQKYSTQGLSALLGGRSGAAPKVKPNTRFLQNLVKNADTHNVRLKRKEDAERREKLRKLDEQEDELKRDERARRREAREERDGSARKRRRLAEEDGSQQSSRHHHRGRDREKRQRRHHRRNTSSESPGSRSPAKSKRGADQLLEGHRSHRSHREDHADDTSTSRTEHRPHRKHTRRRTQPLSPPAEMGCQDSEEKDHNRLNPQDKDSAEGLEEAPTKSKPKAPQNCSKMDAHFSADYNPSQDAHHNSDEDSDWDRALNAMRDRANFQRAQASRLLAAGFSEEQVKKWESQPSKANGKEGADVRDVKWGAKGEQREWDRGKPLLGEDVTLSDPEDGLGNGESKTKPQHAKKAERQQGWKKSGGLLKGFKNALRS